MKSIFRLTMVLAMSAAIFGCYYCERNPMHFEKVPQPQAVHQQSCELIYDKPGQYTLDHDISTDFCAIEITADNVELDLNGHTLRGPKNPQVLSYGVRSKEKSGIKIRNGYIDGFYYGILIKSDSELNITISGNEVSSMIISNSAFRGIGVSGHRTVVANNSVGDTGPALDRPDLYSFGIEVHGSNCRVSNNEVVDTYGSESPGLKIGEGVAISFSHNNNGCLAEGNVIYNNKPVSNKSTFGFWVDVYSTVTLKENTVTGMHYSGIVPTTTVLINNNADKPFAHGIFDRE